MKKPRPKKGLPRPLSHSSISLYRECPQKYKFKYIDKIPEKPKYFFSFGSSVHSALEFLYSAAAPPAPTVEALLGVFKKEFYKPEGRNLTVDVSKPSWELNGYRDADHEAKSYGDGVRMLRAYYDKHIDSFKVPYFVEYNFKMEVDGIPLTGKVDRIDKLESGRLSILDYKTGKNLPKGKVDVDAQLTMYQMACEELLGAEVEGLTFYHVPSLRVQTSKRHPKDLVDTLRKRVVDTAESILKERFDPRRGEPQCNWCDYQVLCPEFKDKYFKGSHPVPYSKKVRPSVPDPEVKAGDELSDLVDRYGDIQEQKNAPGIEAEVQKMKSEILSTLDAKGYVRAFGSRFEVTLSGAPKWRFADKKKMLNVISEAGLYGSILLPSRLKIDELMSDPSVDKALKARLAELGEKVESPGSDPSPQVKWRFPDRDKVIDAIKEAGLYERILAPMAMKVDALMSDPNVDKSLKARLAELGEQVESPDLEVKPLSS